MWQLDAATAATVALQKAQATQVYAGLNLWPAATTARLVEAQLAEDGTYPNARAVFAEGGATSASPTLDFDPDQPRDWHGRWTEGGSGGGTQTPTEAHGPAAVAGQPPSAPSSAAAPAVTAPPPVITSGLHAPDGTPIEQASLKSRARARALAAIIGAVLSVGRLLRRWLPEEPDEQEPTLPNVDPSSIAPTSGAQTKKNKLAQSRDPRIRSDLADQWIKDDGTLNWPLDNNGADGPETSVTLQSGQIVDRYGDNSGAYLSPQGTPFSERSLPYDPQRTPLRIFRVLKPFTVESGRAAPWFGEPGGGLQFRTKIGAET